MQIYDLVVAGLAGVLALRGWRRGFVREVVELVVLVLGTALVFRFSPVIGAVVSGMANVPDEVGRIVGGIVMFMALIVAGIMVSSVLSMSLKVVPGATTLNRVGGAIVGGGYAAVIVVLVTTLLWVTPMPQSVRDSFDTSVEDSIIGSQIVAPHGLVQATLSSVSGEQIFGAVIAVRDAVGDRLAAGTLPIPLPQLNDDLLVPSQTAAQAVFDELNTHRIGAGLDPLTWSADLAVVAVVRSSRVYRSGMLGLDGELKASLAAEGIPGTVYGEMVAIAATPEGLAEAFWSAAAYQALITDPSFRLAGVGVVEGPYGLIAVQVLSG